LTLRRAYYPVQKLLRVREQNEVIAGPFMGPWENRSNNRFINRKHTEDVARECSVPRDSHRPGQSIGRTMNVQGGDAIHVWVEKKFTNITRLDD